jgi:hypothetical protein
MSSYAYNLVRLCLRHLPGAQKIAHALHEEFSSALSAKDKEEIAEITPLNARVSAIDTPRLNLLLPGVSKRHLFGGASTALQLLEALGQGVELRILVTDEWQFEDLDSAHFSGWDVREAEEEDARGNCLVPLGRRYGITVPVRRADIFIASAWWTAHLTRLLAVWQSQAYGLAKRPFVYLIQDFEPGFYPWSAKYVLAEQTYHSDKTLIAVFNSSQLRQFLHERGYRFEAEYVFEPVLNPVLSRYLQRHKPIKKQRQILVYGRPSVPRNAFPLIVQALRLWAASDPLAPQWRVLSAGEAHPSVNLANGMTLAPLGKLELHAYAQTLSASAIGLALMISPHPSYPPLDMAAFGLRTLTNDFGTKRLGQDHPNIIGLSNLSPEFIATQLAALTADFDDCEADAEGSPWSVRSDGCIRPEQPFPFIAALREHCLALLDGM